MTTQTNRWRSWLFGAGLAGLALFGPGLYDLVRQSVAQRRLQRQLAALAAEEDRLKQEQDRLEHDPAYVEGLIRTTFKWAQSGEVVVPLTSGSSHEK